MEGVSESPGIGEEQAAPDPQPEKASRARTIAAIAGVVVLVIAALAVFAALSGLFPNPFESAERQKIQGAAAFFKAVSTSDAAGLLGTIPDDAVGAGDGAFWLKALKDPKTKATLKTSSWSADVLSQVYTSPGGPDTKASFVTGEGDQVKVSVSEGAEPANEPTYFLMVREISGWKVRALVSGGEEFVRFDAASAKKLRD